MVKIKMTTEIQKTMQLKKLEAVVFDMDGLMFDSERIVQMSWNKAGEILGYGPLGENIYHTLGFNLQKRAAYFKNKYGEDFPFEKFLNEYRKFYQSYVKKYGLPVKTGLQELLLYLKNKNIKMAIATSSSDTTAKKNINRAGITHYFDVIISGNMVKKSKPFPEIYQTACKQLNVLPEHAMALEDAPNGLRAAYAAGMMAVMIPDLLKDSSSVDDILFAKKDSLLNVRDWLQENLL